MAQISVAADFLIEHHGSISLVQPLTLECRLHLEAHAEASALWFGSALAVEPRYLDQLIAALEAEGFYP